ncbi:MAG: tol-pal system protein YbgF [Hydrogenovibrio sp.]|uniref:tol-pal system protein YbgF n=1 Tax=Hydrogenovibrio sp. TaxID=2065821 RepID=UPI00286FE07A|nr:tol-pal system protein YbgF [Hydrogenovibrio sp.]MDR9498601.1 tol-pal system protein YbgF [Hydrogenovibrio sp.]
MSKPTRFHSQRQGQLCAVALLSAGLVLSPVAASAQTLEERVERLERKANNPILVQMSRKLGQQQTQIQEIFNQLDLLEHRINELKDTQTLRYQDNEARISELETSLKALKKQAGTLLPAGALKNVGAEAASGSVSSSDESASSKDDSDETASAESGNGEKTELPTENNKPEVDQKEVKQLYDDAFTLLRESKYEPAVAAFKAFMEDHPDHPLSANAAYWQGEALSVLGKKTEALKAFEYGFETFPQSNKAADAMLRSGDTLDNLGRNDAARERYQSLIDAYPDTRSAEKAQSRLKAMK